ncbi:MAG: phytanoyl-CoA dioxygenase family protein [Proteobacteria bacterium]|jgi:hypothetical protein|nr:phytanoyl-CoA dioxygenase family protein [Pseudomonadota bacterium]MDA1302611.1 phytanoyl-CoA dioxygenase family protein [Pseudomonadota bacterium]
MVNNAFGEHSLLRFDYDKARAGGDVAAFDRDVLAALDSHGFVVIENALPGSVCDEVLTEMRPFLESTPHGLHGLGGTRRAGALVARSPASHQMISHPAMLRLMKSVLGEQQLSGNAVRIAGREGKGEAGYRYPWHLHLTQIIDVGPGGGSESMPHQLKLHKANGMWVHDFQTAGLDLQVEIMWALTDFTKDNGATHVVLGSHREQPRDGPVGYGEPTIQATMAQGSALVWTGWSVHGAGVNRTDTRRVGMNINYALGFLVQEENQFLACPPHLARKLPRQMQRIIGYQQPAGSLNYVAECQAPEDSVLREDFDVMVPGAHGHPMNPEIDGQGIAAQSAEELASLVKELDAQKAKAIAADDLERALQIKHAISTLRRASPGG